MTTRTATCSENIISVTSRKISGIQNFKISRSFASNSASNAADALQSGDRRSEHRLSIGWDLSSILPSVSRVLQTVSAISPLDNRFSQISKFSGGLLPSSFSFPTCIFFMMARLSRSTFRLAARLLRRFARPKTWKKKCYECRP